MIHANVVLSGCIMAHIACLNTLVQICIHSLEYKLVLNYLTVKLAMMNVLGKTRSQISVYIWRVTI